MNLALKYHLKTLKSVAAQPAGTGENEPLIGGDLSFTHVFCSVGQVRFAHNESPWLLTPHFINDQLNTLSAE